jgi:peptidoglycan/LPS O-acetylase OafA/YrhL
VIAYTTKIKSLSAKEYVVERLSRLYSVVLPALLLTLILAYVGGKYINPEFYRPWTRPPEWLRLLMSGLFLNAIWMLFTSPVSNQPFWSLGYEAWYYVLYGILVYVKTTARILISIGLVMAITGFNIWLLAPTWFLGVFILYLANRISITKAQALAGFWLSVIAVAICIYSIPPYPERVALYPLCFSGPFLKDWLEGLFISAAIFSFDGSLQLPALVLGFRKQIRWMAAHTFSLYLYHFPLLLLVTSTQIFNPKIPFQFILEVALVLFVIVLLSTFTENKRHLWKQFFRYLLKRMWPDQEPT